MGGATPLLGFVHNPKTCIACLLTTGYLPSQTVVEDGCAVSMKRTRGQTWEIS